MPASLIGVGISLLLTDALAQHAAHQSAPVEHAATPTETPREPGEALDRRNYELTDQDERQSGAQEYGNHEGHVTNTAAPRVPLPPVTDAMRAAAFPEGVSGHAAHDHAIRSFALVEKFEWRDGHGGGAPVWDVAGWAGWNVDRLWFRSDGELSDGKVAEADVEALWGHAVNPWWDVVVGARIDLEPGSTRTWAAFGIQGLAPQWFEVQLTGYATEGGQFAVILQTDYDLMLTNRLILQPRLDLHAHAKDETTRTIGSGLSKGQFSMRLRYEVRREFAPYIGFEWERAFGDTGDLVRREGGQVEDARLVVGIRMWF